MACTKARGTLFEPVQSCLVALRARFGNTVTVEPMAISDHTGELDFIEAVHTAHSSASSTFARSTPARGRSVVPCTTLDEYFGEHECLDIVKIDTEGYDLKVLQGARRLLTEKRIRFVQFEYNSHWRFAGSTLRAAFSYLDNAGFRVFLIRGEGLYELDLEFWGEYLGYSNYFACRPHDLGIVAPLLRGML
jgi:FkbM family methyltransferase